MVGSVFLPLYHVSKVFLVWRVTSLRHRHLHHLQQAWNRGTNHDPNLTPSKHLDSDSFESSIVESDILAYNPPNPYQD